MSADLLQRLLTALEALQPHYSGAMPTEAIAARARLIVERRDAGKEHLRDARQLFRDTHALLYEGTGVHRSTESFTSKARLRLAYISAGLLCLVSDDVEGAETAVWWLEGSRTYTVAGRPPTPGFLAARHLA